jgi:type II secretory pathway pseudopilin PulG
MKTESIDKKIENKKGGFALLFAILVSILIVSIGASIISISLRQIILSSTSRESQLAFYAANTGIECAFYWDLNTPENGRAVFPSSASGERALSNPEGSDISCAKVNVVRPALSKDYSDDAKSFVSVKAREWTQSNNKTSFSFVIINNTQGSPVELCTFVTVEKSRSGSSNVATISSQGYNTCDLSNPRAVERGIQIKYTF